MKKESVSVSVIGGGIIGSWTALHLAEAGVRTTLIEQFPLPHTRGSSHGLSRAFRFLGELELDRLDYSLDRWRALEDAGKALLFVKTGLLNFGPPLDPDLEKYMAVLRDGERPARPSPAVFRCSVTHKSGARRGTQTEAYSSLIGV